MRKETTNILKFTALAIALATAGGCATAKQNPADVPAMAAPAAVVDEASYPVYAMELESDETFAFDSAELSSGAQAELDLVVSATGAFSSPTININGYTDRFGSDEYNADLSQRRADAVASYLSSKGVPAAGITATGKGSTNPVVECATSMEKKEAIACLAPNRRTTVDFPAVEKINSDSVTILKEATVADKDKIEMESKALMK